MPILQKRINKDTFIEVLERASSRLAGWRGRFLSLAGRLTLTKAVLASLPVHTMTTIVLPKSTLDKLDQLSRSFLWGSTPEKRRLHLIAWDRVCLPKAEGGLGIRSARPMNLALLSKVGWRLMKDRTSLWARVLRSKYRIGGLRDTTWINTKRNASSTWRSIKYGLREVVIPGMNWVVGDGKDICFWDDKWLVEDPIRDLAVVELPADFQGIKIRELWHEGSGWDLAKIIPYVSEGVRLRLLSMVVDTVTGSNDRTSWGATANGQFTVKSAYSFLLQSGTQAQNMRQFFDRVWRVTTTERVRVFIWLVVHQVIMTNVERRRRHLSASGVCQVCKGGDETILHVLRDCPSIAGIWGRLVPRGKITAFFASNILDWVYQNLSDVTEIRGCPWATLFAIVVWWAWKWRCGNVFGENGRCRDRVRFVVDQAREIWMAHLNLRRGARRGSEVKMSIKWTLPSTGWFKLNTDGASRGNPGLATAGGVVRDGEGQWCVGFVLNIGICSAPLAELWGVYYGLHIAWERGIRRLELEVDSTLVVGFLQAGIEDSHSLSLLVRLCYGFISRDWIVRISHVYREANRLADGLANYAFSLPLGFHACGSMPAPVASIALEDAAGVVRLRTVRV
ncbi:putative ribonuclease H domain, reverse transcriptase zinc-binding domain-containing protein [Arabidopsis thaliana]